jgi:PPP family 3-phenylpropionic acid transporter
VTAQLHTDRFSLRLASFYAALMVAMGIYVPFFPLWLGAKGLDAKSIGFVLAAPIVVRLFAIPAVNRLSDLWGNLRTALIAISLASTLGFALVGTSGAFTTILLSLLLVAVFFSPIGALIDAYALEGLRSRSQPYGTVRLWGSVAFLVANLVGGLLLVVVGVVNIIWLVVAALATMAALSIVLKPLATGLASAKRDHGKRRHLWTSPRFLVVATAASLIQASHAIYYTFSAVDWTARGYGGATVGMLWATGMVAEIALFALSGRLVLSPLTWVGIGAASAILRWAAMSFDPPIALLAALQCLHGFSFAATHLGSIQFAASAAQPRQAATAQGDLGTVLAIGATLATACSGLLHDAIGSRAYLVMAALALLAAMLLGLGSRLSR